MKKIIVLVSCFWVALFSCVKEDKRWIELPPLSANGSNYMAFYNNDIPYIVEGKYSPPGFFSLGPNRGGVYSSIWCDTNGNNWTSLVADGGELKNSFILGVQIPIESGLYDLNKLHADNKLSVSSEYLEGYELNVSTSNSLLISRYNDSVLAGTFSMNFKNHKNQFVKIENGRFDIGK